MATKLSDIKTLADVTKYFRTLPAVREQEEKSAAELGAKRAALAQQLAVVQARRNGPEVARLGKDLDAALAAVTKAKQALDAAYERQRAAYNAITSHSIGCDHERAKLESGLRETADPLIGDFIEWCYNTVDTVRRQGFVPASDVFAKDPITEKPVVRTSNGESVVVVIDALRAAIDAAEALRFTPVLDAAEALRAIAASIPTANDARVIDRAFLAKVLRDDDEGRVGSWMSRLQLGAGSGGA